ncbi:MAG: arsenite methyltransferase [Candidatus Paceibacteria bacterium]|jgi:arsenite methyltransferase
MSENIKDAVRKGYGAVAKAGLSSQQDGIKSIANAFGYSDEELSSIPAAANMGLSCGNPVAMASIREGETVVDLGAGGGLDVFLSSKKVGPTGRAIGIDMTGDMISLARANADKGGYENVKFYLAEIEAMPLPDNSVDCVISNCVLNLCTDKDAALKEIYRVLKPGGRLAISDIALRKELPATVAQEVAAWTGCIAGALTMSDNRDKLNAAGFGQVDIQDAHSDLNAYRDGGSAACCGPETPEETDAGCCAPAAEKPAEVAESSCCGSEPKQEPVAAGEPEYHDTMGQLLDTFDVNEYAASVKIFAIKPT